MSIRKHRPFVSSALAALALSAAAVPQGAIALPACAELATNAAYGLAGNPQVSALTAALQAAAGTSTAYCRVDFTFSGESGPSAGYLPGQSQQLKIRVGLPPNTVDRATAIAVGAVAWNGKNRDLGGGGYAGAVGGVTSSTNLGYVGTSTDTGHSAALGGSFALNPDGTLNYGLIEDFASDGIHEQHVWGVNLAKTYYGAEPVRKYWMGCSTGGRQGHYQAQNFPQDFDGILAGANAFNWDRFITAELWPAAVMNEEVGAPITSTKLNAVTVAALQACDAADAIPGDGIVQDPRACSYSASSFVCAANGGPSSDANCLTPAEANVVNKIWDGPRNPDGTKMWVGWERGATPGVTTPTSFGEGINRYWVHRDPIFNWRTISEEQFLTEQRNLTKQFSQFIGSDSTNLHTLKGSGGKMLVAYGNADQVIPPNGHYNYMQRLFAKMGGVSETQEFYRYYVFPNATHCGGAGMSTNLLFDALVKWVENGIAPDHLVAQVNATRTRKVCMYPNTPVYIGAGSTDDQANFYCQIKAQDDPALLAQEAGLLQGEGPQPSNNDIGNLP